MNAIATVDKFYCCHCPHKNHRIGFVAKGQYCQMVGNAMCISNRLTRAIVTAMAYLYYECACGVYAV